MNEPAPVSTPRRRAAAKAERKPVMTDEKFRRAQELVQGFTVERSRLGIKVGKTALYTALAQTALEPAAARFALTAPPAHPMPFYNP